jgi:hypothetical protein
MGATEAILSLNPDVYVPLQDAAGSAVPYVRPSSVTSSVAGSAAAGQSGPVGDLSWSVNGAGGSYVGLSDAVGTKWATAGSFSLLCAVYLNSLVDYATAVGKAPASGGGTHEYLMRRNSSAGWQFWLGQAGSGNAHTTAQGGSTPVVGVWTWLLGTYDTSIDTVSLYINGSLVHSSNSWSGSESSGTGTGARLGDYQGTGINGRLAHVAFWQSCLTAVQASMIYNASLRNKVSY